MDDRNGNNATRGENVPFLSRNVDNTVSIRYNKTVNQLIREMEQLLDMKVGVLRRSGNVWIETTLTTDWTLEQQNSEGRFLSGLH